MVFGCSKVSKNKILLITSTGKSLANMLTCWVPHSFDSFYLWCWFFANPAPAPAGFEFINPANSGSGRIRKIGIRYIPRLTTHQINSVISHQRITSDIISLNLHHFRDVILKYKPNNIKCHWQCCEVFKYFKYLNTI